MEDRRSSRRARAAFGAANGTLTPDPSPAWGEGRSGCAAGGSPWSWHKCNSRLVLVSNGKQRDPRPQSQIPPSAFLLPRGANGPLTPGPSPAPGRGEMEDVRRPELLPTGRESILVLACDCE